MTRAWYRFKLFIFKKMPFLKDRGSLFYYTLFLIAIGLGFYGYALISQFFTVPLGGDYTQQYVAFHYNFYDDWWTFFRTGKFVFWDHNTFIGADNFTSNTYYGLFSPFLLPILLFPRVCIPQLMAAMMIARMVVGGLFFRLYLKHFGVSEKTSRIFSIVYAFCGWMAYYLWFNNFFEVLTFFPLILLGVEKILNREKPYTLIVGLILMAISNFFMLITICFFGVAYALFRFFQNCRKHTVKDNLIIMGWGIGAFALGLTLSAWVLLPNYLNAMEAPRAESASYLAMLQEAWAASNWDAVKRLVFEDWNSGYGGSEYRVYYPLVSFLYPTISNRYVSLIHLNHFENYSGSIFIFTPSIIMLFVSVFNSLRKKKFSHLIPIIFFAVALFTPFFYHALHVFTVAYSRWQIIAVISMIVYVALNYDERNKIPKAFVMVSFIATLFLMLTAYRLASSIVSDRVDPIVEEYWVFLYQIVVCILTGLLMFFNWKKDRLNKILMASLAIEAVVMGNLVMNFHGIISYKDSVNGGLDNYITETKIIKNVTENDLGFYRIQSSRAYLGNDNIPAVENYNGASTFHSLYNYDVIDFMRMTHLLNHDGSWTGSAIEKRYNLDAFLGVKYYLLKETDAVVQGVNYVDMLNVPIGYTRIDDENDNDGYRLYSNDNFIEMGFSYDTLYEKGSEGDTQFNFFHTSETHNTKKYLTLRNEEAFFKGAILNDGDVAKVIEDTPDLVVALTPTLEAYNPLFVKHMYHMEQEFQPDDPDLYMTEGDPIAYSSDNVIRDRTQIVLTPKVGTYFTNEAGYFVIEYPLRYPDTNYQGRIMLIGDGRDEFGNPNPSTSRVLTLDYHANYEKNNGYFRGFYANEPVKKIIIQPGADKALYPNPNIYFESYSHILAKLQTFKDNPLTDVVYDTNFFSFKTNYEKQRFIITQVAYGDGWKVTAKNESGEEQELKTYNAQGGFVGFVSLKGPVTYEMRYATPYLSTGMIISFTGFLIFGGAIGLGAFIQLKRKGKEEIVKTP
ncbi:MAG: YfhO family protein [Bacilli bacterium]|jgi:uncharacterized membrane protein YfhO